MPNNTALSQGQSTSPQNQQPQNQQPSRPPQNYQQPQQVHRGQNQPTQLQHRQNPQGHHSPLNKQAAQSSRPDHNKNNSGHASEPTQKKVRCDCHSKPKRGKGLAELLQGLLPPSVYNPSTKKILGFLSAEDLLLVALIFLFMDTEDEDNTLMVLALVFVLVSDYMDLSF